MEEVNLSALCMMKQIKILTQQLLRLSEDLVSVNILSALKRMRIPGDILPPWYWCCASMKSYVTHVPASITSISLLGFSHVAATTAASLSIPSV